MKLIITFFLTLITSLTWSSCFNHEASDFKINYTGYKFTEKLGVKGSFSKVDFTSIQKTSIERILKNSKVKILVTNLDTGDKLRDANVKNSVFKNTKELSIKVLSLNAKDKTLKAELKFGKNTHNLTMSYELDSDMLMVRGLIDLLELGMNEEFGLLEKLCMQLHKGKDGVVKTWSDVSLEASLKVTKCD